VTGGKLWRRLARVWWVPSTYFAEGFPYTLVRQLSTVYFRDAGASLEAIGLTSLYGLPWTLKFLWAPLVDAYSTKRRWLVAWEGVLVVLVGVLAAATTLPAALPAVAVAFLLVAVASATHDIAVDGYYLEALNRTEQARWVGFQAGFYRLAMVTGGGVIVVISGWTSFPVAFAAAAVVLAGLLTLHSLRLPAVETPQLPGGQLVARLLTPVRTLGLLVAAAAVVAGLAYLQRPAAQPLREALAQQLPRWIVVALLAVLAVLAVRAPALKRRLYASRSTYALAFIDYLDQPRAVLILAFVATYRAGESFLLNMAYPFLRDIGVSRASYGLAYGTFGISASIAGGLLGGMLIARTSLKRCIWPFVLAQNVLNLFYMGMAMLYRPIFQRPEAGSADIRLVTALIVVEAFGAGLGTAAFMVFIMRTTRPEHKAAHFAIATGLATVSATFAGVLSGFIADSLGFTAFFAFTFLATVPSMAMIPFLPHLENARRET
jgi:PAT family beta-lactamase induction signal transducer AmpG